MYTNCWQSRLKSWLNLSYSIAHAPNGMYQSDSVVANSLSPWVDQMIRSIRRFSLRFANECHYFFIFMFPKGVQSLAIHFVRNACSICSFTAHQRFIYLFFCHLSIDRNRKIHFNFILFALVCVKQPVMPGPGAVVGGGDCTKRIDNNNNN